MRTRDAVEQVASVIDFPGPPSAESQYASRPPLGPATVRVHRVDLPSLNMPNGAQGLEMSPTRRLPSSPETKLSIGALSRLTGVPVETLRTWEARYGFPVPERKPSGHRVYSLSSIPRLRRIAEALSRGYRAGDVVGAPEDALAGLLEASASSVRQPSSRSAAFSGSAPDLLRIIESFDADALTRTLLQDWTRLGPLEFVQTRIAPALREVGEAWKAGRLEIRHEHFFSEKVGDLLRSLRLPFEARATGPLVVCSSLPGEPHALGLQMASLILAVAGCRILYLGTEVPGAQVASLVKDLNARAVALSVSEASRGPGMSAQITGVRRMLPRRIDLLIGGDGAPRSRPGIEIIQDLGDLDVWARHLATPMQLR